jgi:hypothetical protein
LFETFAFKKSTPQLSLSVLPYAEIGENRHGPANFTGFPVATVLAGWRSFFVAEGERFRGIDSVVQPD